MRYIKKKKKLDELIDQSLNIIGSDGVDSSSIIKSKETTDQKILRTSQKRNPLNGYGYTVGEEEELGKEVDAKTDTRIFPYEDLLFKVQVDWGEDSEFYQDLSMCFYDQRMDINKIINVLKNYGAYEEYSNYLNLNENVPNETKKVFIDLAGSTRIPHYVLIEYPSFTLINMQFSSPDMAQKYATLKGWTVVQYKQDDIKMNEEKSKAKKILEDLMNKTDDYSDIQDRNKLNYIPTLESLEKHHPIVGRNTRILINSIKSRDGVDAVSDAIILDQIISTVDVESLPYNLKKILLRKLQNGGNSNIVNES